MRTPAANVAASTRQPSASLVTHCIVRITISVYLPPHQVFVNHRWPPAADKSRWTEPPWEAAARGDLNGRLVQWVRLWRANLTGGKAHSAMRTKAGVCGRPLGDELRLLDRFVRRLAAPLPPRTSASSWPRTLGQHVRARPGQTLTFGQQTLLTTLITEQKVSAVIRDRALKSDTTRSSLEGMRERRIAIIVIAARASIHWATGRFDNEIAHFLSEITPQQPEPPPPAQSPVSAHAPAPQPA
jgi:hypothetical protein